jgi:multicomponent Na+:H+ antiporter subunit C
MLDMLHLYLIAALVLYLLGIYTLASNRNLIKMVIGIEILVSAVNLNFLALSAFTTGPSVIGPVDPMVHVFVILSICVGGAIAAVAMSLIVRAYRHYGTLDVREYRRLRE